MRSNLLIVLFIFGLALLNACNEAKDASNTNIESKNSADMKTVESMKEGTPKVSPNGKINAQLNCEGSSTLELIQRSGQTIDPEGFECSINNSSTLRITFTRDDAIISLELYEAGNMQIQTGDYTHMTKGTNPYAIIHHQDKTNGNPHGDLTLDIFNGQVTIIDHGMSSNILCGEFDISDNEGNVFKGTFNEMVTSF